ncbi:hypothetical protein JKP88DRAFT_352812 [Tribonema minus]|uniref:Uncharacterized protein n=1 Tax=Tribonema minus TaxID=303371 RepID=A0A835ZDC0_9STRA|nr:hypothetical protein JKP88DRAFT_352812 [Tribonema minus]
MAELMPTRDPTALTGMVIVQTSRLIESVAVTIVKMLMRNRDHTVYCSVQSNAMDMLAGTVEGAAIGGRNWQSPLGLTCRSIDARVGTLTVDPQGLLRRQLRLARPALGTAMIEFNEADFENLLVHPAVRCAPLGGGGGRAFHFARGDCAIDAAARTVTMAGTLDGAHARVQLRRDAGEGALAARVLRQELAAAASPARRPVEAVAQRRQRAQQRGERPLQQQQGEQAAAAERALAAGVARYFQGLTIDLDGVSLRYADMEFGRDAQEDTVKLKLNVVIDRAPDVGKARF